MTFYIPPNLSGQPSNVFIKATVNIHYHQATNSQQQRVISHQFHHHHQQQHVQQQNHVSFSQNTFFHPNVYPSHQIYPNNHQNNWSPKHTNNILDMEYIPSNTTQT